eukprot:TRINITY_DN36530_c0_g2_i3.p1 TRINITY_DN36530_c0_g2~~TRINITY_DN36530_c0_g2_i3.p1  ORF type:complete len:143 (+),score=24.52 TRINITY_DN36530_c0_g2_i3:60-431(+)
MAKQQGVSVYNMSADEDEAAVQDATAVAEALVASMPCGGNVDYEDMGPFLVRRLRIGNNVGNVPCPNVCHADGQAAAKPWVQTARRVALGTAAASVTFAASLLVYLEFCRQFGSDGFDANATL